MRGRALWITLGTTSWLLLALLSSGQPILLDILRIFAFVTTPCLAAAILRDTASGGDTLEELPDFLDVFDRATEITTLLMAALLPTGIAWVLSRAFREAGLGAQGLTAPAVLFLFVTVLLSFLQLVAIGATSVYYNLFLPLRLDLHLRAFLRAFLDSVGILVWLIATLMAFLVLPGLLVGAAVGLGLGEHAALALVPIPFFAAAFLAVQTLHRLGLVFRDNEEAFAEIYA